MTKVSFREWIRLAQLKRQRDASQVLFPSFSLMCLLVMWLRRAHLDDSSCYDCCFIIQENSKRLKVQTESDIVWSHRETVCRSQEFYECGLVSDRLLCSLDSCLLVKYWWKKVIWVWLSVWPFVKKLSCIFKCQMQWKTLIHNCYTTLRLLTLLWLTALISC